MGNDFTYFEALDEDECRELLASKAVGRIAWPTDTGVNVFPVNFQLVGERVVFHTRPGNALSRLTEPTAVTFQTDDIDEAAAIGWSIMVQGTTSQADDEDIRSWAPEAELGIAITPGTMSGRVVSGPQHG